MLTARIETLLGIPPSEQKRTWLLFLYAFGMSGAYVAARTDADALFLARAGVERLPAMILVSATGVTLLTAVYAAVVRRVSLQLVVVLFHALLGLSTIGLTRLLEAYPGTIVIPAALYLLAELRGALGAIHFSTLLNEMFNRSVPARVAGVAGSGSTLAGILLGGATGVLASRVGIYGLLYLIPVLDVLAGVIAFFCRPRASRGASVSSEHEPLSQKFPVSRLLAHPLARYVSGMVALKTVVVVLLEYEWKLAAVDHLASEEALAEFFGEFYSSIFLLTGTVQLLGTSRVLTRLGLRTALASFPVGISVVLLPLVTTGDATLLFWGLTLARGCDVLRRGLSDPAIHLLYWPLNSAFRKQVIAFTGGWIKPVTEAASAAVLIPLAVHLPRSGLSLLIIAVCVTWLTVIYTGRGPRSVRQQETGPPSTRETTH